jgi:hypothetical protein
MATKRNKSSKRPSAKRPTLAIVESSRLVQEDKVVSPVMVERVPLAPELVAPVSPAPVQIDDRDQAREARRQRKLQEAAERERRRDEANFGTVASPPEPPQVAVAVPAADNKTNGHIKFAIPEALKYKLLYRESEYKKLVEPIKQRVQQELQALVAKAIKSDSRVSSAATQLEACVNEILDTVQPSLPEGYAVVFLASNEGAVVAKHAPEQVGKRFQLG